MDIHWYIKIIHIVFFKQNKIAFYSKSKLGNLWGMKKQDRILKLLKFITFTLLIIAPLAFVHPKIDGDAFFMISHGRYIVENGFPTKEILTVHSDYDFIVQKWASCLLFYM